MIASVDQAVNRFRAPLRSSRSSPCVTPDMFAPLKRRSAMQSEWIREGNLNVFKQGGLAKSISQPNIDVLPQFCRNPLCASVSISAPTPSINLIAPYVPEEPRSVHLTSARPVRRRAFYSGGNLKKIRQKWLQGSCKNMDLITLIMA